MRNLPLLTEAPVVIPDSAAFLFFLSFLFSHEAEPDL